MAYKLCEILIYVKLNDDVCNQGSNKHKTSIVQKYGFGNGREKRVSRPIHMISRLMLPIFRLR